MYEAYREAMVRTAIVLRPPPKVPSRVHRAIVATKRRAEPRVSQIRLQQTRLLVDRLISAAARYTEIPADEIIGPCRDRELAYTRFAIMLVARENGKPLVAIGQALGGRDHSTIFSGVLHAEGLERESLTFAKLAAALRHATTPGSPWKEER